MRLTISLSKSGILLLYFVITSLGPFYAQPGDYYRKIHLAEDKVIIEKYDQAIPLYQKAFQSIPAPFLKDLHNALLCAIKGGDKISAKAFIDEIVKFDVDTNFYYKSPKLKELHTDHELYDYLKSQLNTKPAILNADCSFYTKLLALDQSIRVTCKEINSNYYGICGEEIKLLDSINLVNLEKFFLANGVPSDINMCKTNPSLTHKYFIIVKHNMQWGRNSLESILMEAVETFKLHPQLYSDLKDYFNESYLKQPAWYGLGYHVKLGDRLFVWEVPAVVQDSIDERRKTIHLDSIDEFNSKVIFQYRHPEFYLIYPQLIFTLDAGHEMEKELAEKWKELEVFRN